MILKSTLVVVAVAASCFGAWKTYDTYGSVDNSLLMQNIEALTQGDGDTDSGGGNMIWVRNKSGKCWKAGEPHTIEVDSHLAYEVCYTESDRWHSCIKIPMTQYIEQNKKKSVTWTKCQNGDTGRCKSTEVQQEEKPVCDRFPMH